MIVNSCTLKVLFVSDDLYYRQGVVHILKKHFDGLLNNHVRMQYRVLSERRFALSINDIEDAPLKLDASIIFAGEYAYNKLSHYIRCTSAALFGPQDTPAEITKKLQQVDCKKSCEIQVPRNSVLLSSRENVLYGFLKKGFCDKQISTSMDISMKTVSTHRRNIVRKLGYRNKVEMFIQEQTYF
jgi:DNA-binding CsgD family transcriptional regulator